MSNLSWEPIVLAAELAVLASIVALAAPPLDFLDLALLIADLTGILVGTGEGCGFTVRLECNTERRDSKRSRNAASSSWDGNKMFKLS